MVKHRAEALKGYASYRMIGRALCATCAVFEAVYRFAFGYRLLCNVDKQLPLQKAVELPAPLSISSDRDGSISIEFGGPCTTVAEMYKAIAALSSRVHLSGMLKPLKTVSDAARFYDLDEDACFFGRKHPYAISSHPQFELYQQVAMSLKQMHSREDVESLVV